MPDNKLICCPVPRVVEEKTRTLSAETVNNVFGESIPVQRCSVHKESYVLEHLFKNDRSWVSRRMSEVYDVHNDTISIITVVYGLSR